MRILILAEHDGSTLKDEFFKTLSAANQIGGDIDALVIGYQCEEIATKIAALKSINQVFLVDNVACRHQPEEQISLLVKDLANDYTHLLCSASSFGKNILPRVAAYLNVAQISGICAIVAADTFIRPVYAGRLLTKIKSHDAVKIITIMASAFSPNDEIKIANTSFVTKLPMGKLQLDNVAIFVSEQKNISKRKSLQSAKIIVSAGRGLQSKENFAAVELLADKLDAAVGATRAVVDAGWMPNDKQIGQTAQIVAPQLYIALGISGAAQHLAGMKNSKVIIAINKDANAPIFQVAHYGLIADVNDVLPKLNALL